MKDDFRPQRMLLRAVAVSDNRRQTRTVFRREEDADGLSHTQTIAFFAPSMNPVFASVH